MDAKTVVKNLTRLKIPRAICIGSLELQEELKTYLKTHSGLTNLVIFPLHPLPSQDWCEPQWTEYFILNFSLRVGLNAVTSVRHFNHCLESKAQEVVFLVQAEDDIKTAPLALKALLEDIPNKLSELSSPRIGYIVLVTEELARSAAKQNFRQFEFLYQDYNLTK